MIDEVRRYEGSQIKPEAQTYDIYVLSSRAALILAEEVGFLAPHVNRLGSLLQPNIGFDSIHHSGCRKTLNRRGKAYTQYGRPRNLAPPSACCDNALKTLGPDKPHFAAAAARNYDIPSQWISRCAVDDPAVFEIGSPAATAADVSKTCLEGKKIFLKRSSRWRSPRRNTGFNAKLRWAPNSPCHASPS